MTNGMPEKDRSRLIYEAPVLIPLGDLVRGWGGLCSLGDDPSSGDGKCYLGYEANHCMLGSNVKQPE